MTRLPLVQRLPLVLRLALRDLRGGLAGFRVFLACLALGVAAIAGVGSVSSAMLDAIARDARLLLGGDADLSRTHRPMPDVERAFLSEWGRTSETVGMRAMARPTDGGRRTLVELKAVDEAYPLFGTVELTGGGDLSATLAQRDQMHGAVVDPALIARLGLAIGDRISIGEAELEVRATIAREPDRMVRFASFGPRVMISKAALRETKLVRQGSLIHYHMRIALSPGRAFTDWQEDFEAKFATSGWRVRGLDRASPGFERFVSRVTQFLTLVGLATLLVGGVGVVSAVRGHLDRRMHTIATLKCLGASGGEIFTIYLIQVLLIATIAIFAGVALGALAPVIAGEALKTMLPLKISGGPYWGALGLATGFGYLTTLAFSIWPLGLAREVRAAQLFRALIVPPVGRPAPRYIIATLASALVLAGLASVMTEDQRLSIWFAVASLGTVIIFLAASAGLTFGLKYLPTPRRPTLRLAVGNLLRPGAVTGGVMLALGLGLTVLVAIALIQANLSRQISEQIPKQAPAYFFIDIQPHQVDGFVETARAVPGISGLQRTPMVRGRLVLIDGVPIREVEIDKRVQWVVNGDRGLTYASELPKGARITAGKTWTADYAGPPLISMDAEIARGFGVGVGDTITFNILGREITATIASLRNIDWATLGMNFVFVFAPGTLEAAPHSVISTVYADTVEAEEAVQRAVTDRFANISAVRVKDALENAGRILDAVLIAVHATAAVTLLAGVLVLAGSLASGQERRIHDAVVLKVLGATRRRVLNAYILEYGMLGLAASVLAALIGTGAGYYVVTTFMRADFVMEPGVVAATVLAATASTIALGLLGTWRALGVRPAALLRNE
ncbi:MAG: FtsX-like permease family protein [Rhodospirillaceae bacterium]|jgi:putative ABC transport system permease protein|nr:FtsX-like permease family protein [Rhodospirillaceae bacterium]